MIKAEHLCFSYSNIEIWKNISFELAEGEICAIIGKNGTGKTTLLKVLSGLLQAHSGTLTLNNRVVKYENKIYKDVSFLPQSGVYNVNITVFEAILLAVKGASFFIKNEEREHVKTILSRLRILDLSDQYLYELSGGQLKMVFIAQALCRDKKILLFDEPISNLDYYNQLFILQKIRTISKRNKLTTIMTMHDINMVLSFADKALIIHEGGLYDFGIPKKIISEKMMKDIFGVDIVSYEVCNHKYINPIAIVK